MRGKRNLFIVGMCVIFVMCSGCSNDEKEYGPRDWIGTKWKDTDGYELEIFDSSCSITKDGKKMTNVCKFTINSNDSGVGILEICNQYGLECDEREIPISDYESVPDDFYLYSGRWYRQDSE